jgi:hypothetical protein
MLLNDYINEVEKKGAEDRFGNLFALAVSSSSSRMMEMRLQVSNQE